MGALPAFYTARYVEIQSPVLQGLYITAGFLIVFFTVIYGWLAAYNFTERDNADIDVKLWQDYATDGTWWPSDPVRESYCGKLNYTSKSWSTAESGEDMQWGSEAIECIRPADAHPVYGHR